MKKKIILIGGGGHCKACIDVIEQEGNYQIAGIVDLPEMLHQKVLGYEIIATDKDFPDLVKEYKNFLITLGRVLIFFFINLIGFPIMVAYLISSLIPVDLFQFHNFKIHTSSQIAINTKSCFNQKSKSHKPYFKYLLILIGWLCEIGEKTTYPWVINCAAFLFTCLKRERNECEANRVC